MAYHCLILDTYFDNSLAPYCYILHHLGRLDRIAWSRRRQERSVMPVLDLSLRYVPAPAIPDALLTPYLRVPLR